MLDRNTIEGMLGAAREIIKNSYAPYSRIRIASVVLSESGEIAAGVNVENASYGLTVCAERTALFKAISQGEQKFKAILVYSEDTDPIPCGACLQVMAEFFGGDEQVIIASPEGIRHFKFSEIFPYRFQIKK